MPIAGIGVVVTTLDVNLSLLVKPVGKPSAKIVSAPVDAIGRKGLVSREKSIRAGDSPQRPGWLAYRPLHEQLPLCIHAALIPSTAPDCVHGKLILKRKIVKEVQRGRLHMAGCSGHTLACLHAVLESEVEIHVL